jgi:TetR/AcrR family transcriptional regulator
MRSMSSPSPARPRGRPKAQDAPVAVDDILAAALRAFSTHGYDGVSVNALSRELGVSHNLLHQRFGSKEGLWRASVDWAFRGLDVALASAFDPTVPDPLDQLRLVIRRFLEYSAERPELLGLMNVEGREETERLAYIYDLYVEPSTTPVARLLRHLASEGRIRETSQRTFHFLLTHGAGAPFTLTALARRLDPGDPLDPVQLAAHVNLVTEILVSGLELPQMGDSR